MTIRNLAGRPHERKKRTLGGLLALGLMLAGCASPVLAGTITVTDAWIRPPFMAGRPGAAYFTITNHGTASDRLMAVSSPDCTRIELHESVMTGQMMTMKEIPVLDLAPGAKIAFTPGSYHAMLFGCTLPGPAARTARVSLIFHLEKAGEVKAWAGLRPIGTEPGHHMDMKGGGMENMSRP